MPGMTNCDPSIMINGLLKMAKMGLPAAGAVKAKTPFEMCSCGIRKGGPEEIVHLPGSKEGVPLSKADPKAVIDALFPPLPPARAAAAAEKIQADKAAAD